MYVKCGLILKAAEEAFRLKDLGALETLRGKVSGSGSGSGSGGAASGHGTAMEIERMITKLKPQ